MGVIRKTKSVKAILHRFEQIKGAISVVELAERFERQMNKTTVYRILERLEDDGTLHSFTGKDGLRWYAMGRQDHTGKALDPHLHFQCRECGKVECLAHPVSLPALPNHQVDSAEFLLVGRCKKCIPEQEQYIQ